MLKQKLSKKFFAILFNCIYHCSILWILHSIDGK